MMNWIASSLAAIILIATSVVHGFWTDRWGNDVNLVKAAEQLQTLPMEIGEWKGETLESKSGPAPGVIGSIQRTYHNRRSGATVTIALVNGRPGPVATHTPEACYGASGYNVERKGKIEMQSEGITSHFWKANATRRRATDETHLRIVWGWHSARAEDGWMASIDARSEFPRAKNALLNKLYVIRELQPGESEANDKADPCVAFLTDFLPVMQQQLFTAAN
jgi:hypothetical protein